MLLNKSLVLTAIFLITANIVFGQAKNEIDTALLRNHIYKVNTIQTTESDEDLNILGDAVKNVEILMLGEQAHGDGSTFLAKTRVIKYLHENLNFNVLNKLNYILILWVITTLLFYVIYMDIVQHLLFVMDYVFVVVIP